MDIGFFPVDSRSRINILRKKLYVLAGNLGFSGLYGSRMSSIISSVFKTIEELDEHAGLQLSIDENLGNPSLVFELRAKGLKLQSGILCDLFKEVDSESGEVVDTVTAKSYLTDTGKKLPKHEMQNVVQTFLTPLEEELFELIRKKNEELEMQADALRLEKERAEAANHAKSEFLANMSHEIRTPMNAVLGFADILRSIETDSKKKHYVEMIQVSGKALLGIINDILNLSKIESGKMELQYAPVSLVNSLNELQAIFHQKAIEKNLQLELFCDDNLPEVVLLDASRLQQVFINLVGNAIKFTHEGFIRVEAKVVSFSEDQGRVAIDFSVTDSGVGISEDQFESIFGAFEQAKGQSEKEYGGTGLGLAISRRIVELMEGTIRVESKQGEGSTFTVHVPDVEITTLITSQQQETSYDSSLIEFEPATILVCDDIDYNREILTTYLSDWQFTLLQAENGKEAIDLVHENDIDVILLDMKMPVMGGLEASTILKGSEETSHIPIFAVTASVLPEEEKVIQELCDRYIRKPVSKTELIEELIKFVPYRLREKEENIEIESVTDVSDEMVIPEHDVLSELQHLIMRGIMDDIVKFVDELVQKDTKFKQFADQIRDMAVNFEDEELMSLIQELLSD